MRKYIALIFTLFFASAVFAQSQAEVIVTSTFLRKMPNAASEKVQTIEKGEKIVFEKSQETNGFYYVSVSNRTIKGWIRKETVRRLTNAEKVKQPKPPTQVVVSSISSKPPPPIVAPPIAVKTAPTAAPTPAATPGIVEDDEILRVETEEVALNVRVVDGNNRTVKNLNQSQFEVYEDDVLQPITALTTAQVPIINALVIDNSRSLRTQLGKIIEAGKIIVASNMSKDESAVVRFVSKDKIEVVQDFTPNKKLLDNSLDNLFVEGGQTAIIDAVYQTAKKIDGYQKSAKKEDAKIRALVLVSDGDDRSSSFQEQQLFDLLRESQVQIYAVGFVDGLSREPDAGNASRQEKAKAFLTRLAQETGGKVYFPGSIEALPQIAADISAELRTQYLISYTPTNQNHDGTFRKIKVILAESANKEKKIVTTRTGRISATK